MEWPNMGSNWLHLQRHQWHNYWELPNRQLWHFPQLHHPKFTSQHHRRIHPWG
ncbi:unnamed protein product [Linum tenue]|uniref:Uncharacterized protein n=1 Tax=Linum tenue TaxID=586396 RepID=A0AAV0LYX7_9ROSI|nr:unnamed protein product [Linum tenue]